MRIAIRALAGLIVGTAAFVAEAQTVFKLIDVRGGVTYTQRVPKDFDGQVVPLEIEGEASKPTVAAGPRLDKRLSRLDERSVQKLALERREALMREARDRVDLARRALEQAGGGVRVAELERALDTARENLILFEQAGR